MSSAANVKLDCRQVRETINAFLDHVAERRDIPQASAVVLDDDLERARSRVVQFDRAIGRRPEIAMFMPVGTVADALAAALGGTQNGRLTGQFSGGSVRLPVFTGLIADAPEMGGGIGLAARVRLSFATAHRASTRALETVSEVMAAGAEGKRRNGETGVRIDILSLADVIAILARAYFNHVKGAGSTPSIGDILATIDKTEREEIAPATMTGLAAHQVGAIRSYLEQRFDDHPRLGALRAAGYWEAFASLAPRASMDGRRQLASLLWGDLGDFGVVYGELAAALERLNHAGSIVCSPNAVRTPPSNGAGWGGAHPYSVLSAATLLSNAEAAGELIEVRTRFGQSVTVARNILAILAGEATLVIDSDPTTALASADLVQFPMACPEVVPRDASGPPPTLRVTKADGQSPWLARALVQAKSLYLAETAIARHDLTGLVLHLDEKRSLAAPFASIVAEWIAMSHGATPEARQASDTTLFVAVDAPAAQSPLAPLESFLGQTNLGEWLERWNTTRPFDNLFILSGERGATSTALIELATAPLNDPARRTVGTALTPRDHVDTGETRRWLRHLRDAAVGIEEALHAHDGGIAYLAQSIAAIDYVRAQRLQLASALSGLRADLLDTIDRLLHASPPDAENDWRYRAALATQAQLRSVAEQQKLGALIAILTPNRTHISWLVERALSKTLTESVGLMQRLDSLHDFDGNSDRQLAARLAETIVSDWALSMRRHTRNTNTLQLIGLTQGALSALVEELLMAVARCRLEVRVAIGIERVLAGRDLVAGEVVSLAAVVASAATDALCAFVSHLGFDEPWSPRHPRRRGTLGAPLFARAVATTPDDLATMQASRIILQYQADWIEAFGLMAQENVAGMRGMRIEESALRELAELRGLLGASSRARTP